MPNGIPVVKGHAYGNDFLLVPESGAGGHDPAALARAMCHRLEGIGADGLMLYALDKGVVRMRLFNADGDVLWEAQGTDTTVALPESVHLTAGRRYYWSVAGRVDVDRWVESALTDFVIGPTGRQ